MAPQPSGVVRHVFSTRQSQIALAISANFIKLMGRYLTWWWQKVRYLHTHTFCKSEAANNNRYKFSCLVVRFVHRNNDLTAMSPFQKIAHARRLWSSHTCNNCISFGASVRKTLVAKFSHQASCTACWTKPVIVSHKVTGKCGFLISTLANNWLTELLPACNWSHL